MRASLISRLDARDRALLGRWVLDDLAPEWTARSWRALTHAGGARMTIVAVLAAYGFGGPSLRGASVVAGAGLLVSHLIVQLLKRRLRRARPTAHAIAHAIARAHVEIPDQFSFPSGHSAASMSVAFAFAAAFPAWSVPLVAVASIVGFSRVRLGAHYPGDVAAGQGIAIATVLLLRAAGLAA